MPGANEKEEKKKIDAAKKAVQGEVKSLGMRTKNSEPHIVQSGVHLQCRSQIARFLSSGVLDSLRRDYLQTGLDVGIGNGLQFISQ